MRFEGEHRRGPVRRLGALHRHADHRAVAAMDAVEITDGNDWPDQPVEAGTLIAHDDEGMGGIQFGHGGDWSRSMGLRPFRQRYVNRFGGDTGAQERKVPPLTGSSTDLATFPCMGGGVQCGAGPRSTMAPVTVAQAALMSADEGGR